MSKFIGSYVTEQTDVLLASLLSGQNAILLGAPGFGKTDVCLSLVEGLTSESWTEPEPTKIVTSQHTGVFLGIEQSTPPDVITGPYNPQEMMAGQLRRVTDFTPYHPDCRICILDELGRGNDVLFDKALHALARKVSAGGATFWATSNFMPSNERVMALIDRFALWFWARPGAVDIGLVVEAQLQANGRPTVDVSKYPTWSEIVEIRKLVPGPNAVKACKDMARELAAEAKQEGRQANPRRATHWANLLYRVGAWASGSADFNTIPDLAAKMLRYAWPTLSPEEAESWSAIAGAVVDTVGAAIEGALAKVVTKMNEFVDAAPSTQTIMLGELATLMQATEKSLAEIAGLDDERVQKASLQMKEWLARAASGQKIE